MPTGTRFVRSSSSLVTQYCTYKLHGWIPSGEDIEYVEAGSCCPWGVTLEVSKAPLSVCLHTIVFVPVTHHSRQMGCSVVPLPRPRAQQTAEGRPWQACMVVPLPTLFCVLLLSLGEADRQCSLMLCDVVVHRPTSTTTCCYILLLCWLTCRSLFESNELGFPVSFSVWLSVVSPHS